MIRRKLALGWSPVLFPLIALALSIPAPASATTPNYQVDSRQNSENQDSRVRILVLHYTEIPQNDSSLEHLTLSKHAVSAHYLVPDPSQPGMANRVYRLVPEDQRAWHAGQSYWQGDRLINSSSIGIEIVHPGYVTPADDGRPPMQRRWFDFSPEQITTTARLAADIIARHRIAPHKVVGHSDVAPGRKLDPGPKFPWERLYREFNIGAWPEREVVELYQRHFPYRGDILDLQKRLLAYGYEAPQTGRLDKATQDAVAAFQMHFRPARYDGVPDVETSAILDALLEKYFDRPRPGKDSLGPRVPRSPEAHD